VSVDARHGRVLGACESIDRERVIGASRDEKGTEMVIALFKFRLRADIDVA